MLASNGTSGLFVGAPNRSASEDGGGEGGGEGGGVGGGPSGGFGRASVESRAG
eukprot:CAMPEP_0119385712 /NCGR_PEP_ID=MMETSP1334-20130426/92401_1 /TAXON_ID=127549 /ORGANISM="Calcidiscus leptoporus, Strain RCC1130" /LENGTH=52 /DNA_ID=CAMNT_0007407043 /DNA_START=1 /DNA_END=156 /DNA_ORIENTATION=-